MSCEYEIIGGQFERAEEIRSHHCREVVQVHTIVLGLGDNLAEEFYDEDEHIPVYLRQRTADLPESVEFEFGVGDILQVSKPCVEVIGAEWLAHILEYFLQEV